MKFLGISAGNMTFGSTSIRATGVPVASRGFSRYFSVSHGSEPRLAGNIPAGAEYSRWLGLSWDRAVAGSAGPDAGADARRREAGGDRRPTDSRRATIAPDTAVQPAPAPRTRLIFAAASRTFPDKYACP